MEKWGSHFCQDLRDTKGSTRGSTRDLPGRALLMGGEGEGSLRGTLTREELLGRGRWRGSGDLEDATVERCLCCRGLALGSI